MPPSTLDVSAACAGRQVHSKALPECRRRIRRFQTLFTGKNREHAVIELDGAMGEGGGQVLRSALTLAVLTGKPFRLVNIRATRPRPGLGYQHLAAVRAAAEISGARLEGDRIGSQSLRFVAGAARPGCYRFDIGTAGATGLVLQTVLLPLALARGASDLTITGGTHVPWSPCYHYLDWHWRPLLARAGIALDLELRRAGFYPRGGGEIHASLSGDSRPQVIELSRRGRLQRVRGLSAVAELPEAIGERQRRRALRSLRHLSVDVDIQVRTLSAASPGTLLLLLAECEQGQACFSALGARGKPAERVADEATDGLLAFLAGDGAVDPWIADQLLLPLAVAKGRSWMRTSEVTGHLLTNAAVIRRFLPIRMVIDGAIGSAASVQIEPGAT
jgi:RNA 3'-terminal phosphate cyclase (ATP)